MKWHIKNKVKPQVEFVSLNVSSLENHEMNPKEKTQYTDFCDGF